MTNFWRRLKYYGFGFGLGLIFVFFFFKNRGCSWTPSNRVKNTILERVLVITDETKAEMKKLNISVDFLVDVLDDGDVEFSESDRHGDSKVYLIKKEGRSFLYTLPAESFISEVKIGNNVKGVATSTSGTGNMIHFPNDNDLVYVDSSSVLNCQQDQLNLEDPRKILKALKESGKVDFAKSKLDERPKPEQYIIFKLGEKEIGAKVIWYKNKLNFVSFEYEGDNCTK